MNAQSLVSAWRRLLGALRAVSRDQRGITLFELLTAAVVISVLATMMIPYMKCQLARARYASMLEDLRHTRAAIEAFEAETGDWPCSLQEAFGDRPIPATLDYCSDTGDFDKGDGNEFCFFYDADNPGNSQNASLVGIGYKLWTTRDVSACTGVKFVWMTCCGDAPKFCIEEGAESTGGKGKGNSEDTSANCEIPGHPGNSQGVAHDKDGRCAGTT
jgi:Tfp pilus assembly protein PilE